MAKDPRPLTALSSQKLRWFTAGSLSPQGGLSCLCWTISSSAQPTGIPTLISEAHQGPPAVPPQDWQTLWSFLSRGSTPTLHSDPSCISYFLSRFSCVLSVLINNSVHQYWTQKFMQDIWHWNGFRICSSAKLKLILKRQFLNENESMIYGIQLTDSCYYGKLANMNLYFLNDLHFIPTESGSSPPDTVQAEELSLTHSEMFLDWESKF